MDVQHIKTLIDNDTIAVRDLYYAHRNGFFGFGKKYQIPDDALADIYQEAFVALRKQAIAGKLYEVNSSLRTYLFGIGKNMIFNYLKREKKFVPLTSDPTEGITSIEIEKETTLTIEQELLRSNFKKLGEKCKQMLTMFYYRGLSIDEIAEQGGYENANVVRSQKSRCLKTLKERIKATQ